MLPEKFEDNLNGIQLKNGKMKNTNTEMRNLSNRELSAKDILANGKKGGDDEATNGLLDRSVGDVPVKVIPGQRILIREDTIVAGCVTCSNGKLVGYAEKKFGPKLCWNHKRTKNQSACLMTTLVVLFLLSLIGTITFFFTDTFNTTLFSNMMLINNSKAFNMWSKPPVHPIMRVHVFNYTNVDEFMDGTDKKLRVQDVGPYAYKETRTRVNIVFNPNGTVTYQDRRSYQMMPDLSVGAQYDRVVVPNLPMLSAISMAKDTYYMAKVGLSAVFNTLNAKAFKDVPLHRFLWGYEDDLVNLAKPFLQLSSQLPPMDKFGILVTRNGTIRDVVTMNTGVNDMKKFAIIDRYNGNDKLPHWGTDECNRVDASDGTMFPPSMVDKEQTLYIYNQDICRRLPFIYEKDVEVLNGIRAYRYSIPDDVFDSPKTNPANQCFCHMDSGLCAPRGIFNSSPCAFGAPALASFPHFYLGDPALVEAVDGLDPTPDKHAMYIDLHPTLGFPLGGTSRIQINIQVKKSPGISGAGLEQLPDDIILPIAWLELTVEELPQEVKTLIYHGTYSANAIRLTLTWGCAVTLVVSGLLLILTARGKILERKRSRRTPLPVITTKS